MKYLVNENEIDLHIHSFCSDGYMHPRDIADSCLGKLKVISITDHDTMEAYAYLDWKHYRKLGLRIIPGVEMSAIYNNELIDVLAYDINPRLYQKLRSVFYRKYPNRYHYHISLKGAKKLTHLLGGKLILAHPYNYQNHTLVGEELAKKVISENLIDGIECFHTYHTKEETEKLLELADKYNLLVTAGSDFHRESKVIREEYHAKGIGHLDVLNKDISKALNEVKQSKTR